MRVDRWISVLVEVTIPPHGLPEQAAISEVDPTPQADTFSCASFLHHPGRELVQAESRFLKLILGKGSEYFLEHLGRGRFILSEKGPALGCEGKLDGPPVCSGFRTPDQASADQSIYGLTGCRVANGKEIGHITDTPGVRPCHELQNPKLRRRHSILSGFFQLLFHPLVDGRG